MFPFHGYSPAVEAKLHSCKQLWDAVVLLEFARTKHTESWKGVKMDTH